MDAVHPDVAFLSADFSGGVAVYYLREGKDGRHPFISEFYGPVYIGRAEFRGVSDKVGLYSGRPAEKGGCRISRVDAHVGERSAAQ